MKRVVRRSIVVMLVVAQAAFSAGVSGQEKKSSPVPLPFSPSVLDLVCSPTNDHPNPRCDRFTNPAYVAFLTGSTRPT